MRKILLQASPVWGLYGIAVLQPLLDLLAQNVPLLFNHRLDPSDLLIFVAALAVGIPLIHLALVAAATRLAPALGRGLNLTLIGGLAAGLALQVLHRWAEPPVVLSLLVAGSIAAASMALYARFEPPRLFLRYLALAIPVIAALFIASPQIAGFLVEGAVEVETPAVTSKTPVVMVVFDELPLVSLLDRQLGIDAQSYPHFAELAATSTWYRNATTVWERSEESLVSILTGQLAERDLAPALSNYPQNLFTLLSDSHQLRVFEQVTRMLPSEVDFQADRAPRRQRLSRLSSDVGVVFLHLVTPRDLRYKLPAIDAKQGHFWQVRVPWTMNRRRPSAVTASTELPEDERGRADRFASFLEAIEPSEEPRLYFLHSLLPHTPYHYFPSGKVYKGQPYLEGDPAQVWQTYPWFGLQVYQRHLLQVRFVDRLIGELLDRLRQSNLLDRSLVIVTADHGITHWPAPSRRHPTKMPYPDDILRVPLFVKAPFQSAGVVDDRNVQSFDILPTIVDHLGIEDAWPFKGRSALQPNRPDHKLLLDRGPDNALLFRPGFLPEMASLERKLRLFDPAAGELGLFRIGEHGGLVGRQLEELEFGDPLPFEVNLDQEAFLAAYDPSWRYIPAELTGRLRTTEQDRQEEHLAFVLGGRIAAVTHSPLTEGRGLFSALVPESALRPGENPWQVFLVRGSAEEPRLHPPLIKATQ